MAIGSEIISRIVGYTLLKGNFRDETPNLPQSIAILAEANSANQVGLATNPVTVTSAKKAGELFGFGSPIYNIMRILRPNQGSGVGGIPTVVYAQPEAGGSAAKEMTITPSGTATANGTHTIKISGRTGLDGVFYNINIITGDTVATVSTKIADAINAVLGCPVSATATATEATAVAKWKGLTSQEIVIEVDLNDTDLGITYVVAQTVAGSGTPSVQSALDQFGNTWHTIVINSYGEETGVMDTLEAFNGIADPDIPTGRYDPIVWKPFVALTGSTSDDPSSITDARKEDMTIALCPAPNSDGMTSEAAANYALIHARIAQDKPNIGIGGKSLIDMPTPDVIGSMSDLTNRQLFVSKGCSTVDLVNNEYQVQDFVTTYHPDGETPPAYRYVRDINVDMNMKFGDYLIQITYVLDKQIANDDDTVTATDVIKPKELKGLYDQYAVSQGKKGLIADVGFMQDSIVVGISPTNPNRLNSAYSYKRSGVAIVVNTDATAGFNFGTV